MDKRDLFDAVERGDLITVKACYDQDKDIIHSQQPCGSFSRNVLGAAVCHNHVLIAKFLLEQGSKSIDYSDRTDLHTAACVGNYEMFLLLLEYGVDPFKYDQSQTEELEFFSSGCGCGEICEHKTFKVKNVMCNPILHNALGGKNLLIMDKIVELGCDLETENHSGMTALQYACYSEKLAMVKYLVSKGANINASTKLESPSVNVYGMKEYFRLTPLGIAIKKKNVPIVKYLLRHGAKSDIITNNLDIAMLLYDISNNTYKFDKMHRKSYSGKLRNIDPSTLELKSAFGTVLEIAITKNNILTVKLLLENGAKLNPQYLKACLSDSHTQLFQYLYPMLPDNNLLNEYLEIATRNANDCLIKYLLGKGATVSSECLSNAWTYCDYGIFKTMLKHVHDPNMYQKLLFNSYGNPKDFIIKSKLLLDHNIYEKNIFDELLDDLKYLSTNKYHLLLQLITTQKLEPKYVVKINKFISEFKSKIKNYYNAKEPRCPADEMNLEWSQNINLLMPILELVSEKYMDDECRICLDRKPEYILPKCGHRVVCNICVQNINACPQCTLAI